MYVVYPPNQLILTLAENFLLVFIDSNIRENKNSKNFCLSCDYKFHVLKNKEKNLIDSKTDIAQFNKNNISLLKNKKEILNSINSITQELYKKES